MLVIFGTQAAFVVTRKCITSTTWQTENDPLIHLVATFRAHDGHAAKIAERIASKLVLAGCAAALCDTARSHTERRNHEND